MTKGLVSSQKKCKNLVKKCELNADQIHVPFITNGSPSPGFESMVTMTTSSTNTEVNFEFRAFQVGRANSGKTKINAKK